MKEISKRHWIVVLALALIAHVSLIGLFFEKARTSTAEQAGLGGITVSLGPSGGVSGTPEPEIAVVEEIVEPEVEPPPPEPEPIVKAPTPKPKPKIIERPKPKPPEPVGTVGKSGTQQAPDTGSQSNTAGGGIPDSRQDYDALLSAWLEKHKEYPRRARLRRQQGTVVLRFVMTRDGQVLDYNIERSSGFSLLDREVKDMIERAQPLPPLPDNMKQATLERVVPVQFFLR